MRQTNQVLVEPKPLGVIDVLTAGFELVRKRPWTMLVPFLIDIGIWLLPRISLADLMRSTYNSWMNTPGLSTEQVTALQQQSQAVNEIAGSLNLFTFVAVLGNWVARLPSLFTPSLINGTTIDVRSPINALAYTLQLPSFEFAFLLFISFFLLVLFAGAVYAELVAQGVRPLANEERFAWIGRVARLWLRLIGLAFFLGMILFMTSFVLGLTLLIIPAPGDAGSFFYALVLVGWFWLSIYFFFTVSAMAVGNIGLFDAIRRSVLVLRVHFWPSLLLIGLTVFLSEGLSLLWRGLTVTPLGLVFGIAANAFVGTSLLAASMIFYQDRMNAIARLIAHAQATSRTLR